MILFAFKISCWPPREEGLRKGDWVGGSERYRYLAEVTQTINSRSKIQTQFLLIPEPVLEEASLKYRGDPLRTKEKPEPKGTFGNDNQNSQGQKPTRRVAICTWAICVLPVSPASGSEERGRGGPKSQARQTGLNKESNWEPQQALEPRKGRVSSKARLGQGGAHSRLF